MDKQEAESLARVYMSPATELNINDVLTYLRNQFIEEFGNKAFDYDDLVKFYRVKATLCNGQIMSYCFIAKQDFSNKKLGQVKRGDIFKCDSWSQPAKHKRGSMLDRTTWDCFERHGIVYLK